MKGENDSPIKVWEMSGLWHLLTFRLRGVIMCDVGISLTACITSKYQVDVIVSEYDRSFCGVST